jgi:hypothetical protein
MANFLNRDNDLVDFPFNNPMSAANAPANTLNVLVAAPNAPVAQVNAGQQAVEHPQNRGPLVGANEKCPMCMFNVADHGLYGFRHCFCLPCLNQLLEIRQAAARNLRVQTNCPVCREPIFLRFHFKNIQKIPNQ